MRVVKSMLLDFKASKTNWKYIIIIFMCLALLMIFSEGEIMTFFFTFFLFLPFWQFPFDAYDKCSMLYLSVPQKKSDIMRGRYLLAVLGIITAFFINTCFGLIFNPR